MRVALGTSSCRNSNRFAVNSAIKVLTPVTLPLGRARLATRPEVTGSSATLKMTGIVVVAALAANAAWAPPVATMRPTCRRTNSAAIAGTRSV
jgi:hypothetical protein